MRCTGDETLISTGWSVLPAPQIFSHVFRIYDLLFKASLAIPPVYLVFLMWKQNSPNHTVDSTEKNSDLIFFIYVVFIFHFYFFFQEGAIPKKHKNALKQQAVLFCSSSDLWEFCYLHTINEKVSTASRYLNSLIKYGLLTALSYLF